MSYLAALVLLTLRPTITTARSKISYEESCFWTFCALVRNSVSGYFKEGMEKIMDDSNALSQLVEKYSSPSVVKVLADVDFEWIYMTPIW
jgi:hypothetical protein